MSSPPKPLKPLKKTFRCALGKLRHFLFSTYCPRIFSLFSPYFSRFQALLAPLSSPYVIPGPTMFTMLSLFSLIISLFSSYYLPISLYHFRLLSSYFYPHGMQQVTQHEKPHNFSGFESYCRIFIPMECNRSHSMRSHTTSRDLNLTVGIPPGAFRQGD